MNLFENPFEGMSLQQLLQYKAVYELRLAQNSSNYLPPINKKTGRPGKPVGKMPWMIPHWERGLQLVNKQLEKSTQ